MEDLMAITLALVILLIGVGVSLTILEHFDKKFFFMYTTGVAMFFLAAAISVLCVLNIIQGTWLIPGITAVIGSVMLGSLLFSFASEERLYHRLQELKKPIDPIEAEKGLDWKKVEKWLYKNERKQK